MILKLKRVDKPPLWFASIFLQLHNKENVTTAAPKLISLAEALSSITKQPNSTNVTMGLSSNLKRTSKGTSPRDEVMRRSMYTLEHNHTAQNRAARGCKVIQLHIGETQLRLASREDRHIQQ